MGNITAVKISHNAPNLDIIITKNLNKIEIHIYTNKFDSLDVISLINNRQRMKKNII